MVDELQNRNYDLARPMRGGRTYRCHLVTGINNNNKNVETLSQVPTYSGFHAASDLSASRSLTLARPGGSTEVQERTLSERVTATRSLARSG